MSHAHAHMHVHRGPNLALILIYISFYLINRVQAYIYIYRNIYKKIHNLAQLLLFDLIISYLLPLGVSFRYHYPFVKKYKFQRFLISVLFISLFIFYSKNFFFI